MHRILLYKKNYLREMNWLWIALLKYQLFIESYVRKSRKNISTLWYTVQAHQSNSKYIALKWAYKQLSQKIYYVYSST